MHHTNGTGRADDRPLLTLTTRGLLQVALYRLEGAWDRLDPRERSLILDVLNLVASRHHSEETPVKHGG